MSKRLQVLLPEDEMRQFRRISKAQNMTVAEWVRSALREAARRLPIDLEDKKLSVIRGAVENRFPTADIEEMLAEIRQGYDGSLP